MKKTYFAPVVKAVDIEASSLLAGSLNSSDLGETSNGGNTSDNGITGGDARDRSLFDWNED